MKPHNQFEVHSAGIVRPVHAAPAMIPVSSAASSAASLPLQRREPDRKPKPLPQPRQSHAPFHHVLVHVIFGTRRLEPCLISGARERLWPHLRGIARANGISAPAIGGMADHVHALLSLPTTMTVANVMQLLKDDSLEWLHENFPELGDFAWQEGYCAFSIGIAARTETIRYIETQEEHHQRQTFRQELDTFLNQHGIPFEPAMLD